MEQTEYLLGDGKRRLLRHLADEAGIVSDDQGRECPHQELEYEQDCRDCLAAKSVRVQLAAATDAGRGEWKAAVDTGADLLQ